MGSIVCKVGVLTMVMFWILLSLSIPFIGGSLGDLIYRSSMGKSLDSKPYTYFISVVPVIGPIISAFIVNS